MIKKQIMLFKMLCETKFLISKHQIKSLNNILLTKNELQNDSKLISYAIEIKMEEFLYLIGFQLPQENTLLL